MSNNNPLATALGKAKGLTRRRTTNKSSMVSTTSQSRQSSTPETCSFCGSEAAAVCISKSITNTKYALCLLHYYTTRSCRIDPKKVSIADEDEVSKQLPYIQELFSEAFVELQNEIATECARSFNEMKKRESDPLSILNDRHWKSTKFKPIPRQEKSAKEGGKFDGGFTRHVQQREVDLMEEQKKRSMNGIQSMAEKIVRDQNNVNPYKRRKVSTKSSWHLILNNRDASISQSLCDSAMSLEFKIKCNCGGDAMIIGSTMSKNNDVAKAETWGTKKDCNISERYQCQKCGKVWNQE